MTEMPRIMNGLTKGLSLGAIKVIYNMKRIFSILTLLIISSWISDVYAQDITISATDLVNLKNEVQSLKDLVTELKKTVSQKDLQIESRDKCYNVLFYQKDSLQSVKDSIEADNEEKKVLILKFQENEKFYTSQMQAMQEQVDRNVAKLANGRLFFKYSDNLVQPSIKSLLELKTEQVRKDFNQALELLQAYKTSAIDVKNTLIALQSIDRAKWYSKHRIVEYKEECMSILKQSAYYQKVYTKKGVNSWSIPYLDNLIDAAKSVISKHNPVESEFANFSPLIEML